MLKKPKYESHKLDELFVQKEVVRKTGNKDDDESKNLLKAWCFDLLKTNNNE